MTVLSATRARIKLLPEELQKSVEAELAMALARRCQKEPAAALAKQIVALFDLLEDDTDTKQEDDVDDLRAGVTDLFRGRSTA